MTDSAATILDPNRDVAMIDAGELAHQPCPPTLTPRGEGFQVIFTRFALDAIHAHGQSSLEAEICGVLVGRPYQDEQGPYLLIHAAIEGDAAHNHAAQVTFTAQTWAHIQDVMDNKYPDDRIVGWYHTHPGFGIFLSGMDLFIQDNFFNLPWQVAFVYDPKQQEQGLFTWQGGTASPAAFLIRNDAPGQEMGQTGQAGQAGTEPAALPRPQAEAEASTGGGASFPIATPAPAAARPASPGHEGLSDAFSAAFPAMSLDEYAARLLTLERRQRYSDATLQQRIEVIERRNRWLGVALAFTISFVIAWTLVIVPLFPDRTRPVKSPAPTTAPSSGAAAAPAAP
jgi:proteasome lid subunit RPN8/RPN11